MAELLHLVARQVAADGGVEGTSQESLTGTPGHCDTGNEYNGDFGLRISAIFVILVGSLAGTYYKPFHRRWLSLILTRSLVSYIRAKTCKGQDL